MSIATTDRKAGPFLGDGVTTEFPFEFKVYDKAHLKVILTSSAGVESELVLDTDYTVSLSANQDNNPGGRVTLSAAPASGEKLTIITDQPATQEAVLNNMGGFFPKTIEKRLDWLTILVQQLIEKTGRAIIAGAVSDADASYELGTATQRAGKFMRFDSNGALELAASLPEATLSRTTIGQFFYPLSQAEASAGLTDDDIIHYYYYGDVRRYGAVGDGVTDDTAALRAAEAVAFAAGIPLVLPAGYTFGYNGVWEVRVSVLGYQATLKQLATQEVSTNTDAVLRLSFQSHRVVRGLTIDANFKSPGICLFGGSDITVEDVVVKNTIIAGMNAYQTTRPRFIRCASLDCRYAPGGGTSADGFFFGGVVGGEMYDCYSYRPRRIGFVSDSDGPVDSDKIKIVRCTCEEPHHCDDSTTEYNAAVWVENTVNADVIGCTGLNIASGTGQTSGRVIGMVLYAVGASKKGALNAEQCRVFGGAGYIPFGYLVSGDNASLGVARVTECYAEKVRVGLSSLGGLDTLDVVNLHVHDLNDGGVGSRGGVVIDGAGASILNRLRIDGLKLTSATLSSDSAWVNVFQRTLNTEYSLRNVIGGTHVMRQPFDRVTVENCRLDVGSESFSSFIAGVELRLANSTFALRSGAAGTSPLADTAAAPAGVKAMLDNCTITGVNNDFGGDSVDLFVYNCRVDASRISISSVGTFLSQFHGVTWTNIGSLGAIRTNFNAPTSQTLIVHQCYFAASDASHTPLQVWNSEPQVIVLHDNVYNTTDLHNFSAPDSEVDNVAI